MRGAVAAEAADAVLVRNRGVRREPCGAQVRDRERGKEVLGRVGARPPPALEGP